MKKIKNIGMDLKEQGFEIIKDILSNKECNILINDAHLLLKKVRKDTSNFSPIMHPHRYMIENSFLKTMKKKKIVDLIQKIISGPVMGLQSQFFFMPPKTPGFLPHQDDYYVKSEDPDGFVSLWIALTDIKKENGSLRLWPNSHKEGIFEVKKKTIKKSKNIDKNGSELYSVIPEDLKEFKELEMKKGTGLLLHSRVLHSSRENLSEKFRYVILYTYIRENLKYNPGFNAKRKAIKIGVT